MNDVRDAVRDWWLVHIRPERHPGIGADTSAASGLRARLRRPSAPSGILAERTVHELAQKLPGLRRRPHDLANLVRVIAAVRAEGERIAVLLGRPREGEERPPLSDLRFQRLIRSSGDDLATALRRALPMVKETCNVGSLASDMLDWPHPVHGERVRMNWCFDYFGAARPAPDARDNQKDTTE